MRKYVALTVLPALWAGFSGRAAIAQTGAAATSETYAPTMTFDVASVMRRGG
jgi:hypothetical protein